MKTALKFIVFIILVLLFAGKSFCQTPSINIEIIGQGSPVIFLPGFGCPGSVWDEIGNELKEEYECHIVSYPGFNNSTPIDTLWFETVEKQISEHASSLGTSPIGIGHSIGGTFLMKIASESDSVFSKLILVDAIPCITAVMMPNVDPSSISYNSSQNKSMLNMPSEQFSQMVTGMANFMCVSKEKQDILANWFENSDRKTWVYGYTSLLRTDLRNSLNYITAPTTIIAAKNASIVNVEQTIDEQFKLLKTKKIYFAEDSFHFIMYDKKDWLLETLTEVL